MDQLEAFYWIERLHSFRAAASQLGITQPTISLRIRALETTLGTSLFDRSAPRLRLSDAGLALVPAARRMVELGIQIATDHSARDPLRGHVRLGAPASFGLSCMATLLGTLRKQYPELTVALTIDNSVVLCERLNARGLDLAFVVEPNVQRHVRVVPLGAMTHAWVGSPSLGLRRRTIDPRDLLRFHVLTHPEPSSLSRMVLNWFSAAGLEPQQLSTCNDLSVIIRLTVAGEGVSLLPPAIVTRELDSGQLQRFRSRPEIERPRLYAAHQVDKAGRGVSMVIQTAQSVIKQAELIL